MKNLKSIIIKGALIIGIPVLLSAFAMNYNSSTTQAETGTIKGKVIYKGGEVRKVENVIKDEHTCGTNDIMDESLITDENGGIEWAVVSITSDIKGGKSIDKLPGNKMLDQSECVFKPHVVLVGVNKDLTIKNSDHTLHNVRTISVMNDIFNKAQIYLPGMPAPKDVTRFSDPEIIESVCDVHGWMKAYIHVVEHPYHSITDEHGNFELTEVPAGKYTLSVWHETLGAVEGTVVVKAGETAEINFTLKK